MSYQQKRLLYSKRHVAVMQRAAFEEGAKWARNSYGAPTAAAEALRRYPSPKLVVTRIVGAENGIRYSVSGGALMGQSSKVGRWFEVKLVPIEDLALVNDLFANPTEEVDG